MEQLALFFPLWVAKGAYSADGTVTSRYLADAPQLLDSVPAQSDWKICICGFSQRKWRKQNQPVSFGIERVCQNPYLSRLFSCWPLRWWWARSWHSCRVFIWVKLGLDASGNQARRYTGLKAIRKTAGAAGTSGTITLDVMQ